MTDLPNPTVTAENANLSTFWDQIWKEEGVDTWRQYALLNVYNRIQKLMPPLANVIDVGGGIGVLGRHLREGKCEVEVWDHSATALLQATVYGLRTRLVDLEAPGDLCKTPLLPGTVFVATEVLEHLSPQARQRVLALAAQTGCAFFSVPNNRLGPEEEPQHTIKFTAKSFKTELERYFKDVRVECMGDFLLGVCGFAKSFKLSFTMPIRDEAADLEKTLMSFRGVADEMVIGIDPRTTDGTMEIALQYADHVFFLEDPEGWVPGKYYKNNPTSWVDERVSEGGVHFAWLRNQCINRCTGDWIFMCEGHEPLVAGQDELLHLDRIDSAAMVSYVIRSGGPKGQRQQWCFPWLFRNHPKIRFSRSTHNRVEYPESYLTICLPQVRTLHERDHTREQARTTQRKGQNRIELMRDWLKNQNENSLYYLASEWREYSPNRAIAYFRQLLTLPKKNGPQRYQTRLILAKMLAQVGEFTEAREILLDAAKDDWTRTDHWIWLGDMAFYEEKFEEALQFYMYGAVRVDNPPMTAWWIDLSYYSWLPMQRLAMVYGELGDVAMSLYWARQVLEAYEDDDMPTELIDEAERNIDILEEAINASGCT